MPTRLAQLLPDSRRAGLRRLRRRLRRHRRLVAAAALAAGVAASLRAVSPPAPTLVAVGVAAHDLPGGTVLSRADLALARLPPGNVPAGALADVVGRTLAGPVRRGEPFTDVRLIGTGLFSSLRPGTE